MLKAYQTKFGEKGNCWVACVASLLGIGIEDVPEFDKWAAERNTHWYILFEAWLLKEHNFHPMIIHHHVPVPHIVGGTSPRGISHSVIYEGAKLIHDPYPDGGGVKDIEEYFVFIPRL